MFSNQYHLFVLLQESLALSAEEKNHIFQESKSHPEYAKIFIKILEKEQMGIEGIKKFYKNASEKIQKKAELLPEIRTKILEKWLKKTKEIRKQEKAEKFKNSEENLNSLPYIF